MRNLTQTNPNLAVFATKLAARHLWENMMLARRIVRGDIQHYDEVNRRWFQPCPPRDWFTATTQAHRFHPAVEHMICEALYRPRDWHLLLLEWPHRSVTDPSRIAYTRDERAGMADRQTVTTIGKYLTRHFNAPDNVIRDVSALYGYGGDITITNDMDAMIDAVKNGPRSCMSRDLTRLCDDGEHRHPYAVYDPGYGWAMAVRRCGGEILGRALVWRNPHNEDDKCFVRSYKREHSELSHSGTDEAINTFLQSQGYELRRGWPADAPLAVYQLRRSSNEYLMPYIDGCVQTVNLDHAGRMFIDEDGTISADNTDGRGVHRGTECDHCGDHFDGDNEGGYVGRHEDSHVCQYCLDNHYTYVYGRRGNQYYIPSDDAVYVDSNGEYYDPGYLGDNDIVEAYDGNFYHIDDVVYVESRDAYFVSGDDDVVYAEDSGQYEMREDCWLCNESRQWYTNDTDYVEVDGETYHPDNAPEPEDDEDAESSEVSHNEGEQA